LEIDANADGCVVRRPHDDAARAHGTDPERPAPDATPAVGERNGGAPAAMWRTPLNGAPRPVGPLAARASRRRAWGGGAAPEREAERAEEGALGDIPGGDAVAGGTDRSGTPAAPASWWPIAAGMTAAAVPQPAALPGRRSRSPALLLDRATLLPAAPRLQAEGVALWELPATTTQAAQAPVTPPWLTQPTAHTAAKAGSDDARNGADAPMDDLPAQEADTGASATPAPEMAVLTGESAPDLYLEHFGLHERPFSLVPDPGFLFWSRAHARAHSILEYGILTRAPITLITGEVGAGKTTLVHHLLRRLGPGVTVGLISNAHGSRGELLRWVLMALGQAVPDGGDYVTLFSSFQRFLIDQYAAGRRVVLIFDEAQNLDRETLEELRMFTNVNANKDELLQLVLVGQPELRQTIARPDMAQFAQRVAASFHLPAMDLEALRGYIAHRVKVAGATDTIFRNNALGLIHEATGGVPRLVNQLCDLALVYAYTRNHKTVSRTTVQHVLDDGVFFGAGRLAAGGSVPGSGGSGHAD
jgi:type II secretory pathway predicted ATPase ExeA